MRPDFEPVFAALKQVLVKYESRMTVVADQPDRYALESTLIFRGKPMFFGEVKAGKAYVSFHLMPLYMNPKLNATISPELKRRMHGKTCFNFTTRDSGLIEELKRLTAEGLESFKSIVTGD